MGTMDLVSRLIPRGISAGAVLAVGLLGPGVCIAQETSQPDSRGYLSAGFGAQAPQFHRSAFEIGYKNASSARAYGFAVNLRFGRYSAFDLLGQQRFEADGFTSGARPLYASAFYGMQGPLPLARSVPELYARASAGLTFYLGQSGSRTDPSDLQPVPEVALRVAPGAELAVGIGRHGIGLRPWSEIRLGTEYISNSGLGFVGPVIAIGLDIPAP
jgi:hypothetical protein